jgi:hypothetical protein
MLDDVTSALEYLDANRHADAIVIGGLLGLTATNVIPALFLAGYLVRVLRAGLRDDPAVPAFDEWLGLLRTGLGAGAVALPYQIVPMAAFVAAVGPETIVALLGPGTVSSTIHHGFAGGAYVARPDPVFVLGAVATVALELVFGYLSVVAVANYAREGSVRAGFAVETIRSEATCPETLVACAVGALGLFGVGVARGLAGHLPLVGPFAGSLVAFYGHVVIARFLGFRYASRTRSDAGGGNAGAAATAD